MYSRRSLLWIFLASCSMIAVSFESIATQTSAEEVPHLGVYFSVQPDPEAICDFCTSRVQDSTMLTAAPATGRIWIWQENSMKPTYVARDHLFICSNCVRIGHETATEAGSLPQSYPSELTDADVSHCDFCSGTCLSGRHLVAGSLSTADGAVTICDVCLDLCIHALA